MSAPAAAVSPIAKVRAARVWFLVALLAALIAAAAGWQWWTYQSDLQDAARAYRFNHVEVVLTQPPFDGISTQIEGDKWLADGPRDIVKNPDSLALYDTITFKLRPLTTGSECSHNNIVSYQVLVDAPGFTVDTLGGSTRSKEALLAPVCSLSAQAPTPVSPWRWNLMATRPGNHVVTLLLIALDRQNDVVDSREVDIPVFVPTPPQTIAADIGLISVVITIISALIGLWERFRPKTA